jgi:hypothetical protein
MPARLPRTVRDLTPEEAAYLAGLVDADGYISRRLTTWTIGVTNTDPRLIDWCASLGGHHYLHRLPSGFARGQKRQQHVWVVHRRADVEHVGIAILPYLLLKRNKALDAIRGAAKALDPT